MPIQYQCGSSMAIRQICLYKYTDNYIIFSNNGVFLLLLVDFFE